MTPVQSLTAEQLYRRCDLSAHAFASTAELEGLQEFIGQERASQAIDLAIRMRRRGYNMFALGSAGTGKLSLVRKRVEECAAGEPRPPDWCYVNNFEHPSKPGVLRLPAGMGRTFRSDMQRFTDDLRTGLSAAFESEEVQVRRQRLTEEVQEQQQASLVELQEKARARNLALLRTPAGLAFAPLRDGNVLPPEEFEKLSAEDQERIKNEVETLQQELQRVLYKVPGWERELRQRMRSLHEEVTGFVLNDLMDEVVKRYQDFPQVLSYLEAVRKDVITHVLDFLGGEKSSEAESESPMTQFLNGKANPRRYQVNLLVDSSELAGAPVIYESNPTYLNLIGRVEQFVQMGALFTDFMLIKSGCLHRANGGYLILDALRVLTTPYGWEGLKRALQFGEIRIESPLEMLSLTTTISLEPEPIPLDVKVVLLGDRTLYYLLSLYDADFNELFKISADFEDELERTPTSELLYARVIAEIVRKESLRPFERSAVERLIEHSARIVADSERLTTQLRAIVDLMQQADYWAGQQEATTVASEHVQQAIDAYNRRLSRIEEKMREEVVRRTLFIDTDGEKVGQINALSVVQMGNYAFGHPTRITASIRLGRGEVVDIEREAQMGGPIHSKGVLILSSFLRARYELERPLSLAASLVFEQSYGGVEGDSASSTELYALLSAISGAPISQSLAVTGSVNQLGQVQAIGGVNEKIEGFFDLCAARGLNGEQGALIPSANVKHLMLKQEVVEAVRAGKFHIYPIETIDQGIEVLTGIPVGERQPDGSYPEGTINRRVVDRLKELAEARRKAEAKEGERRRKPALRRQPRGRQASAQ